MIDVPIENDTPGREPDIKTILESYVNHVGQPKVGNLISTVIDGSSKGGRHERAHKKNCYIH